MAYTEQFIVFGKKAAFDAALTAGNLKESSIVFIEDTKQIWTQGTLYSCPFTAVEIQEFLESKVDKVTGKSLVADDLITKLTALKPQTEITSDINAVKTAVDNYTVNGKKISTNPVLAKGDVGLGNVDNTSDINKPVSTAQAAAIADAKKAGTDAQADLDDYKVTNDTAVEEISTELADHKADKDKKHIPAGGHERQLLAWKADGEAQWEDLANMFTGLEELLAYGVEWKDNVADPHITRIGNMSLHKTLPIQSQLKGCIAQVDKVIYWLAEDDWRFRKDPIYMDVDLSNDVEFPNFGEASIADLAVGQFVKAGTHIGKIAFIEGASVTVEWEEDLADISAELTTITKLEIGSRLDGYDGTVRVYCPNFYIKSQIIGNTRRVWLSTVKIDNTWTYQHEILIDAYRSTVLNTVPENMGYLSTLPVNSAISVVNTATYCRGGGNRPANDKYLTGADDTTIDIFRTDLGKPRTSLGRPTMRTYSRNANNEMLSYNQYKNIFYWLYVVEYANFNCQEAYNATLTEDGYHQGGMGASITNMGNWNEYNGYYPLTPCGYGNKLGNGTGLVPLTIPEFTYGTNNTVRAAQTMQMARWRGFDNPFGDIWTNLDGIVIERTTDLSNVWTTDDASEYTDVIGNKTLAGKECLGEGYIKLFDLGETAEIIPSVNGGGASTTQYKCDYHWRDSNTSGLRTLLVGGHAFHGGVAGLGYFDSTYGVSYSTAYVGFRSVSSFMSFSNSEG